jgi:sortase A
MLEMTMEPYGYKQIGPMKSKKKRDISMKEPARLCTILVALTLCCLGQSPKKNQNSIATQGAIVGRLEIPRLRVSVLVREGAGPSILAVSAGHIEGTALPGRSGNMGIAAHRDMFFGPLREIQTNDLITVRTISGTYEYAVKSTEVVAPTDVHVLRQTVDAELTLVTCYPFRHKGPSPQRFIVHATRVGTAVAQISGGSSEAEP